MIRSIVLSVFATSLLFATTAVRADLVAHLSFDGDLLDASPNANNGTYVGEAAPPFVAGFDGTENSALSFDGADDYVDIAQNVGLPVTNEPAFTIAMWVKGEVQSDKRVFSEGSSENNTPLFNLGTHNGGANGTLNSFLRPGPGHRQSQRIAFDGSWHHIAWVDVGGRVDVYIDGVRDPANLDYERVDRALNTTTVGGILRGGPCCLFTGCIDEVYIYNHALSAAEVQALIPTPDCPEEGDTHCTSLNIESNGLGGITATAEGGDDSGDSPLLFTFTASNADGDVLQVGPQEENTAQFELPVGTWTISSAVDDDLGCFDAAPDGTCQTEVVVEAPPQQIGKWSFDGDLLDSSGNDNHGTFFGGEAPNFVEGFDGTPGGAIEFDGVDDYVRADHNQGLPIYRNNAYTVAMWVKGGPQPDFRVFSEGSTTNNNPLLNVGTDNTGSTGKMDIFIRFGSTLVGHAKSNRNAFDETWHHIAWVDDNGVGAMYIDGVREGGVMPTYTRPAAVELDTTTIGAILRASPSHWFIGAIDEVCVFNFALSDEEVAELVSVPADCDEGADTHCTALSVEGPKDNLEGAYTLTVDAVDDGGDDPLFYTFHVTNGDGSTDTIGPQESNTTTVTLSAGDYTISASVDDDFRCPDDAEDSVCNDVELTVVTEAPIKISSFSFDGDLLDSQPAGNDGVFVGGDAPSFVPGFDCTNPGAVEFDGVDDFVNVATNDGLPVTAKPAFTIAMWVKGPADQRDKRIFSESNTQGNNSPLFNLGTDSTNPPTGLFDFFYRDDNGTSIVNHRKSEGVVFDDTWHHVAWVDDDGAAVLYIDGEPDPTDFTYERGTLTLDATTIGGILRGSPCCLFIGSIDDVMIFNFALSQEEVQALIGDGAQASCGGGQIPGDCNQDGTVDVSDAVCLFGFLFQNNPEALPCGDGSIEGNLGLMDWQADGLLDLSDGVAALEYLFRGGPAHDSGPDCTSILACPEACVP